MGNGVVIFDFENVELRLVTMSGSGLVKKYY